MMTSRDEIVAIYAVGPDAVVALVEQLLDAHARQMLALEKEK